MKKKNEIYLFFIFIVLKYQVPNKYIFQLSSYDIKSNKFLYTYIRQNAKFSVFVSCASNLTCGKIKSRDFVCFCMYTYIYVKEK